MIEYTKEELEAKEREEARYFLGYCQRKIKEDKDKKTLYDFIPMCPLCRYKDKGKGIFGHCRCCYFNRIRKDIR